MPYDATKMADWQISEAAEGRMKSIFQLADEMGLRKDEVIPSGRIGRLDFMKIIDRLKDKPDGKYIAFSIPPVIVRARPFPNRARSPPALRHNQ